MKKLVLLLVGGIILFLPFNLCSAQVSIDTTYSVNDLQFSTLDSFDVVGLKGCDFYTDEVGKPMLPVQELHILLPKDAKPESISVTFIDSIQVEGEFYIYPAQPPYPTDGSPPPPFVEPDSSVYNSDSLYPGIVCKMGTSGYMSGYKILRILIYPLQYRPLSKRLFLYTAIQLNIEYSYFEDLSLPIYRRSEQAQKDVDDYVKALVVNPEDIDRFYGSPDFPLKGFGEIGKLDITDLPSLEGVPVDYVIVTSDEFIPVFEQLAEWKTKKGIVTIVRSKEEITNYYYGCDDAEKVRNFIKDCYSLWGTIYVLLAGDMDRVPIRYGFYDDYGDIYGPTDLYFATVEGNWNADGDHIFGEGNDDPDFVWDVWIGRAPVSTLQEAELFVNKVLFYEKTPPVTDYLKKMLLLGASSYYYNGYGAKRKEDLQAYLDTLIVHLTLWEMYGPKDDTIPPYQWSGDEELTVKNMFNAMNEGYHFINHMGHAGWFVIDAGAHSGHGWFGLKEASDLSNADDKYSIFWSIGCGPIPMDYESIAEVLMNNPDGGCVAFIGNTRTGSWGQTWQEKLFWQGIFTEYYKLGWAFSSTTVPGDTTDIRNMNLLGDPEMVVWTDNPKSLLVTKPDTIEGLGTHTIVITVMDPTGPQEPQPIEGALVCLLKGDEAFGSKKTDINGEVTFTYKPESTGKILVTVTAHNFLPYEGDIEVLPTDEPYVCFDSEIIDDDNTGSSIGNGDGDVNPGETIEMPIILKNNGEDTAYAVHAILDVDPGYVTIIEAEQDFGDIPEGGTSQSLLPYVFEVSPDCERYEINFYLTITDKSLNVWEDDFVVKILADSLFHTRHIVTINDVNGNGILDPDEEVYIDSLEMTNYGHGGADDVEATLTPEVPGITMIKDYCFVGDIPGFSYVTCGLGGVEPHGFIFKCNPVPPEFEFTLTLTDRFGREWQQTMDLSTPYPPDAIWSDLFGQDFCSIEWKFVINPKDPDICGYNIFRSFSESGPFQRINSLPEVNVSTYNDIPLFLETKYWYKLRTVDSSGNESGDSPILHLKTNPPFQTGWPKTFPKPTAGNWSSAKVGDIDGDGDMEIVMGYRNYVFSYHHDGTIVLGWPKILEEETSSTPALADLDGDGTLEIIYAGGANKELYAWKYNGENFSDKWPVTLPYSVNVNGSPLIADLEGDGIIEIIVCSSKKVFAYHPDGNLFDNWGEVPVEGTIDSRFVPSIADLDGDGIYEVILGSFDWNLHSVYINAFDHTGNFVNYGNWPFEFYVGAGYNGSIVSPPSIADFDNDGKQEVVIGSLQPGRIFLLDNNGDELWQNTCGDLVSCAPGIVDFNNDHKLDIFFVDFYAHGWAERADLHVVDYQDGNEWLRVSFDYVIRSSPVFDGENIIVKTSDGKAHFFNIDGTEPLGSPFYDGQRGDNYSTPTISDIDLDGDMEVTYSGSDKRMYIWNPSTIMNQSAAEWSMFKHDNWNTGNYDFVIPETYGTTDELATAYNNQRKIVDNGSINVVYSSLDKVFFTISEGENKLGQRWILGDGRFPALSSYIDVASQKILGAVWVNKCRIDFSRYTDASGWSDPHSLIEIVGVKIHYSPPSLVIDDDGTGHLAWEKTIEPLHYPGDITYELHYSTFDAGLEQPVIIEDDILDEAIEYVNHYTPEYVSASLDLDDNNNPIVAWSRGIGAGKNTVYLKRKIEGIWPDEPEVVSSQGEVSNHPFCDIEDGMIHVVWEEEGIIRHRQRGLATDWISIETVSNPLLYSRSPQIIDGDICFYAEYPQFHPDHLSNVVYRIRLENGEWLPSNIIESTRYLSEYPQSYMQEIKPSGRIFHTVWTEGNDVPYEIRYKMLHLPIKFSGRITENTTWESDIYITGDVLIDPGVTLTINPGVNVFFVPLYDDQKIGIDNQRSELIVEGKLLAEGTETDSIHFVSAGIVPEMSDYYGIRFTSPDTSSLNYVSMKFAKYSINCEKNSTPLLQNVSISNSEMGVRAEKASPTIKKCNIFDNHTGIYCAFCSGVVIDSCDISNNKFSSQLLTESGVEAIPFDGPPDTLPIFRTGVSLNRCDGISFTDNRVIDNYVGVSVVGSANGVFENNYVEANEWHGFDIAVRKGSQMQFIDNTFINNAKYPVNHGMDKTYYREFGGLALGFAGVHTGETDILIKGNTFEDNTSGTRFCKYYHQPSSGTYNVRYEDNISTYNFYGFALSAPSGVSGYTGILVFNEAEYNESAGVFIWFGVDSGAVNLGNIENVDTTDDGANHLSYNVAWEVMNICPYILYAQGNFWGTTDTLKIDSKIYDDDEDPSCGMVDFSGYYAGGKLTGDETWSGTVSVCGDIIVPEGVTLTIEEGTTIRFSANYDINNLGVDEDRSELIVDGNLIFSSTSKESEWSGGITNAFYRVRYEDLEQKNQSSSRGMLKDSKEITDEISNATSVVFTSDASDPLPGDWYGIRIDNQDNNELKNCKIEYAKRGITLTESFLKIEDSYIENCSDAGLYSEINLNKSRVISKRIEVKNDRNPHTKKPIGLEDFSSQKRNESFEEDSGAINLEAINCVFNYNATGIWLEGEQNVSIRNSTISNSDDYGIIWGDEVQGKMEEDSLICNNTSILLRGQSEIKKNTIINSTSYGIFIENEADPCITPHNIILGSGIYDVYNNTDNKITAMENYWGTMNINSVKTHIYDYYSDNSLGIVEVEPLWDGNKGIGGTMTSGEAKTPLIYSLKTPSPSPFKDNTTIYYSIAKSGKVSLKVYDITGRYINVLENGIKDPGVYSVGWNGCDNNNRKVATGVYFTRLTSGNFTSVRKVILVR